MSLDRRVAVPLKTVETVLLPLGEGQLLPLLVREKSVARGPWARMEGRGGIWTGEGAGVGESAGAGARSQKGVG